MKKFKLILLSLLLIVSQLYSQDWKVYKSGNYTYIENLVDGQLIEGGSSTIEFRKLLESDTSYRIFKDGVDQLNFTIDVTDMEDINGITFTSSTFESFKELNSGSSPNNIVQNPLTAFGDLRVAELSPQFQGSFEYTVDNTDLNSKTITNGGTVTQSSGMAVVSTSTTTSSTAMFESKRHARYKSGLGGVVRFTALFTDPVADTEQYIGLSDEPGSSATFENGYIVGYDGLTFGYHRFQNDTKITTSLDNWDDPLDGTGISGAIIDQTKLNIFFIQYQYLGAGAINIWFEKQNGVLVLVHTDKYAGLNTQPSVHNPNFHFNIHVNNKATVSDIIVKSSSYAYFVEGKTKYIELHQPENSSGIIEKTAVTTEIAIFTIRNRSTYFSKTNFIDIILLFGTASAEANSANNLGDVRFVKNATLGGTPSYTNINTSNSVVEIDIAGTTVTGGTGISVGLLAGKDDSVINEFINNIIILAPGETLTVTGRSDNSATIRAQLSWRELF